MSDIPMILDRVGVKMVAEVSQLFEGHYAAGTILMSGLLSTMAAEAFDSAADRLKREIDAMADLLRDGGRDPQDTTAPSIRISDLQPIHDRLAGELIDLQAGLETADTDEARELNARIWAVHLAGATERMPSPPDFGAARAAAAEKLKAEGPL